MKKDELGLTLDDRDPFTTPPAVIAYGDPGSGKSTEVARACQDALYLPTNDNVLAPYHSWWESQPAEIRAKYKPFKDLAKYQFTPSKLAEKKLTTWSATVKILEMLEANAVKGKKPYRGVVLDEATAWSNEVYREMKVDPKFAKNGKVDGWAVTAALKDFHRWVIRFPQRTGMYLILICHARPPTYFDADDESVAPEKRGQLQYKGGPSFATASLIEPMCADADFVLHLKTESDRSGLGGAAKRYYFTEIDDVWTRKARDFRIPPKAEITEHNLQKLLGIAGLSL